MTKTDLTTPATVNKLEVIAHHAAIVFAKHGYARTQMADISEAANVALGTLYRYSASKEDLFLLAVLYGIGVNTENLRTDADQAASSDKNLTKIIRKWLRKAHKMPALENVEEIINRNSFDDELWTILDQVFKCISQYYLTIRILDRSSREWPELSALFVKEVRAPLLEKLESYLVKRIQQKLIRSEIDVAAVSRLIVETIAWFAMHRKFSPGPITISDDRARQSSLDFLVAGLRC